MGRTRKHTSDYILDATERAVVRLGAAELSISAVAEEAGVSKSSVVYDHKSKSALLEALIDRHMACERERLAAAVAECADTPEPELFGRIAVAERAPDDIEKAVALAIGASASSEEEVRKMLRDWTTADLEIMSAARRPEAALMAYLALSGFYSVELLGYHSWTDTERIGILDGIRSIYTSYPTRISRSNGETNSRNP